MGLRPALLDQHSDHIDEHHLGEDDLLFATGEGTPISRNNRPHPRRAGRLET